MQKNITYPQRKQEFFSLQQSSHSRSNEPHTSRAHAMEDDSSEHFDDDDDDASSQGSVVQPDVFAEQTLKDKRKMKKRY